jgi:hypothetical protein
MKTLSTILLLTVAMLAHAGNALITVLDYQGNALVGEKCVLSFLSAPQSQNGGTSIIWRNSFYADGNGQILLTNAASGKWVVTPVDSQAVGFTFYMPVTNGTIRAENFLTSDAGNSLPPDTMSYGVNASDRRFHHVWDPINNATGTNVTLQGTFTDQNGFPLVCTNFVLQGGNAATLVTPTIVGEVGDPLLNPTNLNSIATATDSYNSTFYTVFSGVAPVTDSGAGFFSGENFQVVAPSNLGFGVWVSTNANAAFNQWNYFGGCVEFSNGNGTSRYGITLTQAVSSYYIFRQTAGTPVFQKYVSIAAGSSSAGLGFTSDGNFVDLNLVFNGVVVARWMGSGGVSLNSGTNGNNALAGWPYGVTIGDGHGGSSGTYFGTNGYANFMGIVTNGGLVWYSLKTNATPAIAAPSGSICTTTNGQLYVRSNSVWLLK